METQLETLQQLGPLLGHINQLFTDPPGGELDVKDQEWQRQIIVLLVDMEQLGEDLRNYHPVPQSLEQSHRAIADIGDDITRQADTYRSVLEAIYDGNRFEALGHAEKSERFADAFEDSTDVMLQRLAEECELDSETP